MIIDTQIISYCYSGHWKSDIAKQSEISSITAAEFLLFHTRESGKVDYYVINPDRFGSKNSEALISKYLEHAKSKIWADGGARRTDSLVIDFSSDFVSYRIFGNYAITSIINNKNFDAFNVSIMHLNKDKQKLLKSKFEYLIDNDIKCHYADQNSCDIALDLFLKFQEKTKPKENVKNTINDLIILSTAISKKTSIHTVDKVLSRFAANEHSATIENQDESSQVDFSNLKNQKIQQKRESKGFINRGWSYSFNKGNF